MLYYILRLETPISLEHNGYSVNNVILSLAPTGTPQLGLQITPLSNEVTNRFPFSSQLSRNCPGAPDFSIRDVPVQSIPTLYA